MWYFGPPGVPPLWVWLAAAGVCGAFAGLYLLGAPAAVIGVFGVIVLFVVAIGTARGALNRAGGPDALGRTRPKKP
jgi:hypothetical protein